MLNLTEVSTLAHSVEDVLASLRDNHRTLDTATADLLFRGLDTLRVLVKESQPGQTIDRYAGAADGDPATAEQSDIARHQPLVRHVHETGTAIFFNDRVEPASKALTERHGLPTPFACLPLVVDQHVQGVLVIDRMLAHKRYLKREDYDLLALLCREAAVALQNGYVHQHVEHLSRTDALTGAYNRRHFNLQLRAEVQRSLRGQTSLSLAMCDIDDFKKVNDVYGHAVGDHVLRDIVRRLSSTVREVDVVARYGGEEFALILPDTALAQAGVVAERVRCAVATPPVQAGSLALPITVSVGVASLPPCRDDLGLVQAKIMGKNRVVRALPEHMTK